MRPSNIAIKIASRKEGKFKILTDDLKGPSRFLVFDKNENVGEAKKDLTYDEMYQEWKKDPSQSNSYCYNRKRVEEYGICETEGIMHQSSGKWLKVDYGFCGSSCRTPNLPDLWKDTRFGYGKSTWREWYRKYWETNGVYYENLDQCELLLHENYLIATLPYFI